VECADRTSRVTVTCWSNQVRGVLDGDEAEAARGDRALRKVHVVVATPPALAEALQGDRPPFDLAAARFLVVDEVDACFQVPPHPMCASTIGRTGPLPVVVCDARPEHVTCAARTADKHYCAHSSAT
jgi:hypothetical protein